MKTNEMDDLNLNILEDSNEKDNITYLSGMYKEWFLDYASYVILERARTKRKSNQRKKIMI